MTNTNIINIKNRFKIIFDEISFLVEDKNYLMQFMKFAEKNKFIQENDFMERVAFRFRNSLAIDVCKQIDDDKRSESLINLLNEIKNNNKNFTLKRFSETFKPISEKESSEYFKQFSVKKNQFVCRAKVQKDIRELISYIAGGIRNKIRRERKRTNGLLKFRNKRGAHYNKGHVEISATLEDLYKAVDCLERIVIKYELLINQSIMDTLLPSNSDCEFDVKRSLDNDLLE